MNYNVLFTPPRIGDSGGVETHTMQLALELAKMGNKISIVCPNEKAGSRTMLDNYAELSLLNTAFKIQNTNITPALPFILAKTNADIFHTMMPTPWSADWSALIAKIQGKKLIVTIHSDLYSPTLIGGLLTRLYVETFYRLLLFLSDKTIIVNPEYDKTFTNTRHILNGFKKKITAIPNGVDTSIFYPIKSIKTGKKILFVSVLDEFHEFKGLNYLIKAMRKIVKKIPDAKLTIVGEGPLKNKYKRMAEEFGLSKNISFVGAKKNLELPMIYSQHDVFVLPSIHTESFGIVLIEAMASGVPVIATEYAGMREEIIRENTGLIVPSKDSPSLASAILTILLDKKLAKKMGANARNLAKNNFDWKNVAIKTMNVYSGVGA
jgi:glycosyltransferase involved in cell wall biosynthesis